MTCALKSVGLFSRELDSQRESTVMTDMEQPALQLRIPNSDAGPAIDLPSFERVMSRLLDTGDFDNDKDAARKLRIDPALLSKRKNGQAPWTINDIRSVMERCQTILPIAWLAKQYGYGLVMLETEAERQVRELRDQLAKEREERRVIESTMRRIVVGQMQPAA